MARKLGGYNEDKATVAATVASFPAQFKLRGHSGIFRVSTQSSYMTSGGRVMVYTERKDDRGEWRDFVKGTPEELRGQIVSSGLGNLWSHRRTRRATKKQCSPAHRRQLGGLWSQQSLVSKVLLGYLGIGAVVAVARAVKEVSALPAGATGYYGPIATGAVFDVVAWPYTAYQWAASASAASSAPMKKFSIGSPAPTKTLKKSASGSSTPGYF